ncbi:hypothetical protein V6N11_018119 [Hibiscus sabdariffa]|uniref:Serine-threonine/tyrosine-protein kinase catalytic domain-containing protein n=1 Tax=Hibiscus sabdariffa TaxID=183260 RepID=A0ABR2T700_9ROSI
MIWRLRLGGCISAVCLCICSSHYPSFRSWCITSCEEAIAPELGLLSHLRILDFMWNELTGTIPKGIGHISPLRLRLLNGNKLFGSMPDELGYLSNLNRLQLDQNNISGPIPNNFVNMRRVRYLHLNNNSLSGQIPRELSQIPTLLHLLLDNNNLSGCLPPEFSNLPSLCILDLFGPYELLNFTLLGPYGDIKFEAETKGISKGVLVGVVVGGAACAIVVYAILTILIARRHAGQCQAKSRNRLSTKGQREFLTEIKLLSRLHHRNQVSLVGYCDEEEEHMLVYEFMPNGTLRDWLSAPALEDEGTVADHVSTVVRGTPGYLDPEYFLTHKLTDRSDVYSLGDVNNAHQSGMTFSIIDSRIGCYPSECIERFIGLALSCCQDKTENRPSMQDVVKELECILKMTPETESVSSDSASSNSNSGKLLPSSSTSYCSSPSVLGSDLISSVVSSITPR